ncbi:MAG TPA: hypothetical protein VMB72_16390 [Acidimicrobiales bacterium]|nr:hypothetical protein [Acidimicrobiales bacterium]
MWRRFLVPVTMVTGMVALSGGGTLVALGAATASGAATGPTLSASPSTKLTNGEAVTVTGSGFAKNSIGNILECNDDPKQPTVALGSPVDSSVPVSCIPPSLGKLVTTNKKGDVSATFDVQTGTTGPPCGPSPDAATCPATDSAGNPPATDAAKYPCPPTAAEESAGDACELTYGDETGESADVIILFGSETPPTTSTSTTSTSSTTTTSTTSTTTTSTTTTSTTTTSTTTTTTPTTTTTTTPTTSVTTTQVNPTAVTLGPSGSVSDDVTVQGGATYGPPTGTVAFYACQTGTSQTLAPGPCAATGSNLLDSTHVTAGAGDASTATSSALVPTAGGTWCFSATFTSSSSYQSSSDNTTADDVDPNECLVVATAPSTTASFVSSAEVTLGPSGTVNDDVTVDGNVVGGSPTGTVAFYACLADPSQTYDPQACPATGTPFDPGESLVSGAGDSASATSADFTPTAAGTWCLSAVYGGDANYQASSDDTDAATLDSDECVLVATAPSTTAGAVSSGSVAVGSPVTDTATVAGNSAGGPPAGTVDFFVCGPLAADATCGTTSAPEGSPALTPGAGATASARSSTFTPTATGVYCFAAVYAPSGTDYAASSANQSGADDRAQCTSVTPAAYTIYSADHATATAGDTFTFVVHTYGGPTPKITKKGKLPRAIHFVNNRNGEATLTGVAKATKVGTYPITITATFGRGAAKHVATQDFTLTVVS